MKSRSSYATAVAACVLAACLPGCSSLGGNWLETARQQYHQTIREMKADLAILDSEDDGFDAFGPTDAKHLRAARADMNR